MNFVGPLLHVLGSSFFVQVGYHMKELREKGAQIRRAE